MSSFEDFWAAWPANGSKGFEEYTRKKDKKKCAELWAKCKLDSSGRVIVHDVEQRSRYDKGWRGNRGSFLCAPLVYLRNERWADGEFADIRDEKKRTQPVAQPERFNSGPECSRWMRYSNKYLLQQIVRRGGIRNDRLLSQVVAAKNRVVRQAETEGDWDDDDFKSVVASAIDNVLDVPREAAA